MKTKFSQKVALVLFGIFISICLLEIGLRTGGFVLTSIQEIRNKKTLKKKGSLRVMCLGESTTAGQYPRFLESALNARDSEIKFSVIDKGVSATTTTHILNQLEANLDQYKPDIVTAMIGVNDYGRYLPVEPDKKSKLLFFLKSFKTYKLMRFICLHVSSKFGKAGILKLRKDESEAKAYESSFTRPLSVGQELPESDYNGDEKSFRRDLKTASQEDELIRLAEESYGRGDWAKAMEFYNKAAKLNPDSGLAYVGLGFSYAHMGELSQSTESFKKALQIWPNDVGALTGLGIIYQDQGQIPAAIGCYKKMIEINPDGDDGWWGYLNLASCYVKQKEFLKAIELLQKAVKEYPYRQELKGLLSLAYSRIGQMQLAEKYHKEASQSYNLETVNNYKKIKSILDERGIPLVCIQYPMRKVAFLKKIFEGEQGVYFVDNESLFYDAVQKDGYDMYFSDMFGGDFGHCTDQGNELLGKNIADTILKGFLKHKL